MSRANRRFYRTILVGLVSLGVLVWAAIQRFGIPRREMTDLLLTTVWIAFGTILLAALGAGLWIALRKLLRRGSAE